MTENHDILAAIAKLHDKYPKDKVDLWLCAFPGATQLKFTAYIEASDQGPYDAVVGEDTPMDAVNRLINKVGKRDSQAANLKRIAELRKELLEREERARREDSPEAKIA